MSHTRFLLPVLLFLFTAFAQAGEIRPFDQQAFNQLTQAGKPVVVDVSASWCPTCRAQKPVLEALMQQPDFHDVTLMTIDFDDGKPLLKQFRVANQSTVLAFKGSAEVARSVGDTSHDGLDALIRKAVQ